MNEAQKHAQSFDSIPGSRIASHIRKRLKQMALAGHDIYCYTSGPDGMHINVWIGGNIGAKFEVMDDGGWYCWSDYANGYVDIGIVLDVMTREEQSA